MSGILNFCRTFREDLVVSSSAPSPEIDLSWQMREREARLLASLVRTSRLTVLYGETDLGRTELLTGGVVPLLRRRESDVVGRTTRESCVVIPFPDRRSRLGGRFSVRPAELVVYFDAWSEQPLTGLRHCILGAAAARSVANETPGLCLSDMLEALGKQKDLQFLIVLDRFEELIALDASVTDRFIDEFCEAVNRSGLCANFLLSLSEDSRPRLEGLRQRIQGFDDFSVRLMRWNGVVEQPPVSHDVAPTVSLNTTPESVVPVLIRATPALPAAESKVPLPPADRSRAVERAARARARLDCAAAGPHVPIETRAVYAFIESTLAETAKSSRLDPWKNVGHAGTVSAPVPPQTAKRNKEGFATPDGAVEPVLALPARDALMRGTSTLHAGESAPEYGAAAMVVPASASFVGVSLQSAMSWIERRIRPKP